MSNMNDLSQVLDEMIACGERMIKAANAVKDFFAETHQEPVTAAEAPPRAPEAEAPAEEPPAKTYTFTDVRKAFSAKAHDGHTAEVKALIAKYGADRLSGIREDDYTSLMADLEAIG